MVVGVGTDLLAKERLRRIPLTAAFFQRTFTGQEQRQASESPIPRDHYCNLFAGKEAVFKALRGNPDTARLSEIEILNDTHGAPYVTLHGGMAALAASRGVSSVELSLSGEQEYSLAFAVAVQ